VGGERIQPFYEFKSDRLVRGGGPGNFFSYQNAHKTKPYAYFSSGKVPNGYNAYFDPKGAPADRRSDCQTLGVWPYAETVTAAIPANNRYYNPNTFQIITAGLDGNFAVGTNLTATPPLPWTANTVTQFGRAIEDDYANFHSNKLVAP
jgi:hypothetical protein